MASGGEGELAIHYLAAQKSMCCELVPVKGPISVSIDGNVIAQLEQGQDHVVKLPVGTAVTMVVQAQGDPSAKAEEQIRFTSTDARGANVNWKRARPFSSDYVLYINAATFGISHETQQSQRSGQAGGPGGVGTGM